MSKQPAPGVRPPASPDRKRTAARPRNRLLAALPDADYRRILPELKTVPMVLRHVFHRRGEPIEHVYFPNGGVCSVTAVMKNGAAVEVCQVADTSAEQMPVRAFRKELERRGPFHDGMSRYAQGAVALMMQSTACMALHGLQERCCRWLLMTHDRVGSDQFELSHEFIAILLGSTRPTVTVVAGILQKAGLIRYKHARITIVDRQALEAASCECYGTIKAEYSRLGL